MRERIYSDGMMNKQTRVFNFQCFLCVLALPLSGTFKGHKIGMGFFGGRVIFGPGIFGGFAGSPRDFFGS